MEEAKSEISKAGRFILLENGNPKHIVGGILLIAAILSDDLMTLDAIGSTRSYSQYNLIILHSDSSRFGIR